jgi:hypothetical protein
MSSGSGGSDDPDHAARLTDLQRIHLPLVRIGEGEHRFNEQRISLHPDVPGAVEIENPGDDGAITITFL